MQAVSWFPIEYFWIQYSLCRQQAVSIDQLEEDRRQLSEHPHAMVCRHCTMYGAGVDIFACYGALGAAPEDRAIAALT